VRDTSINQKPVADPRNDYVHQEDEDNANIIAILIAENEAELLMQASSRGCKSFALLFKPGNDSRETVRASVEMVEKASDHVFHPLCALWLTLRVLTATALRNYPLQRGTGSKVGCKSSGRCETIAGSKVISEAYSDLRLRIWILID